MKFAGIWGFWTAFVAFYDGLATLFKEVYGKVSILVLQVLSIYYTPARSELPAARNPGLLERPARAP